MLVYDLGGGTFDVTVMRIENREFTTVATNGDRNLGGFDWDNALMNLLNARFQELGGPDLLDDDHTEADLREKAETAKRALTTIQKTKVVLSAGGTTRTVEVTRKDFEEATSSLLSRTRDLTAILLEDAGLSWSDVDTVLLAGGSTRMPMVREMMESFSGRKPERAFNPDEVVALGAAVQAHIVDVERTGTKSALPAITIRDVTSQGLGILIRADTGNMENAVIIAPNTRIPAKHTDSFRTVSDNQTEIRVSVTQGDDADPSFVKVIGEQILPIPAHPAGAPVDVTFAYDIDQTVFIEVADLTTNRSLGTFEVHDVSNMDSAEKDLATGKIRALEVS